MKSILHLRNSMEIILHYDEQKVIELLKLAKKDRSDRAINRKPKKINDG